MRTAHLMATATATETGTATATAMDAPAAPAVSAPDAAAGALILLALALRLYHIGDRPLWLDETYTAHAARFRSLSDLLAWTYGGLDQMPLLNALTWLLRPLGAGEWALRLPSAIAGALSVLAIYALGKRLASARVGLVAALVLALLPFAVWYGQEARAYALLMLFTTAQMLYAHRAAVDGRGRDWAGLTLFSVLTLYTHYLGLFTAVVACAVLGVALLGELVAWVGRGAHRTGSGARRRQAGRLVSRIVLAAATALLVALTYIPWLPSLRAFLQRGDRGFGMFQAGYGATLADYRGLLAALSLGDLLLALIGLGVVTAIVGLWRGRWREGTLLLLWLAIPAAVFWLRLRGAVVTMPPRYLSFMLPSAVLLAALGVESLAQLVGRVAQALRPAPSQWRRAIVAATTALLALLLLSGLAPALATQYAMPTTDYRDAANLILAATKSPADSVVFAVGTCNDYLLGSLEYYLWLHHSPIVVVDAARVDDQVAARLRRGDGRVWAAVITGSGNSGCGVPADLGRVSTARLAVSAFVEVALARLRAPGADAMTQARTLLRWGSALQPQALSSLALLDVLSRHARLGANLLPAPTGIAPAGRWQIPPGAALSPDRRLFELSPAGAMVNVTLTTRRVVPGRGYVLSFDYRNGALNGDQRVYASAVAAGGRWLSIFPDGAGYACRPSVDWSHGAFAFTPPAGTVSLILWLRATGSGAATFRAVHLRPVR